MSPRSRIGLSGIVLAGGRSLRFGSDKLAADVGGRPLVHRPIAALAAVCQEVIVVIGAGGSLVLPGSPGVPMRIVRDEEPGAGPLAALITGLAAAVAPVVVVAAGDMPGLVPALLTELARLAGLDGVDAAVLREGQVVRPLPMALRREVAIPRAGAIRAGGASSLRALLDALRVHAVDEDAWRGLDPAGASLLDVDRPADLARIGL